MSDDDRIISGKTELLTEKPESHVDGFFDIELSSGLIARTTRNAPSIVRLVQKNGKIWTAGGKWPAPVPGYSFRVNDKAPREEWDTPKGKIVDVNHWAFEVGWIFYDEPAARYIILGMPVGSTTDEEGFLKQAKLETTEITGWKYAKLLTGCLPRAIVHKFAVESVEEAFSAIELGETMSRLLRELFEQYLSETGDVPRDKKDDDTITCPNDDCPEAEIPAGAKFCQTCGVSVAGAEEAEEDPDPEDPEAS